MTQISIEKQRTLELLTGMQHTRTGKVRKYQNRSAEDTSKYDLPFHEPAPTLATAIRKQYKGIEL
jgi:hypothetical protein